MKQERNFERALIGQWVLLVAMLLLLGGLIAYNHVDEWRQTDAQERDRLLTQARVIEINLGRQLEATSDTLATVIVDLPRWRNGRKVETAVPRLQALAEAMPGVRTVAVLDATGKIQASNRPESIGFDLSTHSYFQVGRQNPDPKRLIISPPFRAVLDHAWTLGVARVVTGPYGEFDGMVVATLDPAYFAALMDSVRYAPDTWVALGHGDGSLFLMMPERPNMEGFNLAKPGSFFSRHRESGSVETVMAGRVYSTGESRMIAQRTLSPARLSIDAPLVVAVSRDLDVIFREWRGDALAQGAIFALIAVGSLLTLWRYQTGARRTEGELHRDKQALVASHERFERLAATIPCVLYDYVLERDGSARFLYVSPRCQDVLGLAPEAVMADVSLFLDLIHPDDRERFHSEDVSANRRGESFHTELRLQLPAGACKWVSLSSRPNPAPPGQAAVWSGLIFDITENKTAQAQLEQREQHLHSLIASMNDVVFVVDMDGRISDFHWPAQTDFPLPEASTYIGQDYHRVLPEDVSLAVAEAIPLLRNDHTPRSQEVMFPLGGQPRYFQATFSALLDGSVRPRGFLCVARDITRRRAMETELLRLATTDPLTGVANRRRFMEQLEMELGRVRRFGKPATLLMFDLDHFKDVNDQHGHAIGDAVLKHFADLAVGRLRKIDLFGRLGGEEFGILLPGTEMPGAREFAEKFRSLVAETPCVTEKGAIVYTVSVGIADFDPADPDPDHILARADVALYRAKAGGRNRVEVT